MPHLVQKGVSFEVLTAAGDGLINRARALLAAKFMAGKASHLLFIDSDISWEPESIIRLLEANKDVVCGTYRKKTDERIEWADSLMADRESRKVNFEEYADGQRLIEIAFCGGGFLMIRRSVFERLFKAHPELHFKNSDALTEEEMEFCYNVFPIGITNGILYGEDVGFCRLWQDLGEKVWLDPSIMLTHYGSKAFTGDPETRFRIESGKENIA
jgi:GT2 family glycosyltransferase